MVSFQGFPVEVRPRLPADGVVPCFSPQYVERRPSPPFHLSIRCVLSVSRPTGSRLFFLHTSVTSGPRSHMNHPPPFPLQHWQKTTSRSSCVAFLVPALRHRTMALPFFKEKRRTRLGPFREAFKMSTLFLKFCLLISLQTFLCPSWVWFLWPIYPILRFPQGSC